jgi:6-phosphogluconolactonase
MQINYNSVKFSIVEATRQWEVVAQDAIRKKGRFVVALSGGKTPEVFYQYLARHLALWAKTHIFLVDERVVGFEDEQSNARFIHENLVLQIPSQQKPQFYMVKKLLKGSMQAALSYQQVVQDFFGQDETPRFDLIVLGIGQDGHTASLFPGDAALKVTDSWVTAVQIPANGLERISLTMPIINRAANIFFIVFGLAKANIMKTFLAGNAELPANMVRPIDGRVYVFTDTQAMESI